MFKEEFIRISECIFSFRYSEFIILGDILIRFLQNMILSGHCLQSIIWEGNAKYPKIYNKYFCFGALKLNRISILFK